MDIINFDDLSPEAKQAFVDFQWHERTRHLKDVYQIERELSQIEHKYKIRAREIYDDKWIEI